MKSLIKSVLLNAVAIWLTAQVVDGLSYSNDAKVLLAAAFTLGAVNLIVKPFIKLVMLPINLATLGLFSWLVGVLMLYLTTLIIPGFSVSPFFFPGFDYGGFIIPAADIGRLGAFVVSAVLIAFSSTVLRWLT